ncbi:TetR family transcriptional regulator [Saccharomonospora piscinae]|uniref:TetR family transcriptional regulator n=1 Tax=Saccharomonospora piscinae TaxID=687388 RepID=A0A1V9A7U2_SACPI|nr:TetR family transcriptional regulator [Saccharomonospora piscinae]OQO93207.1 TetR family transcriptional regulator [Saccharomonospora piscinae]TLW91588.1 TetR/AcrR family transcriptional regulator [Saccharomonospora piscinae]
MSSITPFTERARASLREQLLDATAALLPRGGYAGLRMADVATAVGVSRQTVYNEFGSKSALVQAVALRTLAEFTDGVRQRLDGADDVLAGIRAATAYTVRHAKENRLVAAVTGAEAAEDLLPLLTTRGQPVLHAATDLAESYLRERLPAIHDPRFVAETMTRLTLSYVVLPTRSATDAAEAVCAAVGPLLRTEHSDETGRTTP